VIISRHVMFDEANFPFAAAKPPPESLNFLVQGRPPTPAPSSSIERTRSASTDQSDLADLDPAIIWHGPVRHAPMAHVGPAPALHRPVQASGASPPAPAVRCRHQPALSAPRPATSRLLQAVFTTPSASTSGVLQGTSMARCHRLCPGSWRL